MPNQMVTHRDAIRHTIGRVVVAGGVTAIVTLAFLLSEFGLDANAVVPVGTVTRASMVAAVSIACILSGALSYRSALLMRQLTLTRAELLRISLTDPLTGLLNRRGFDDAAAVMLAEAKAVGTSAVALMCDVDRFKSINDHHGHEVGDRVLAHIGGVLREFAATHGMLIARHGGEEFAALMVGLSQQEAADRALALCRLCCIDIEVDGATVQVTMSFGLAAHRGDGELSGLMRRADLALYRAKDLGRNCVVQIDDLEACAAPSHWMRKAEITGDDGFVAGHI